MTVLLCGLERRVSVSTRSPPPTACSLLDEAPRWGTGKEGFFFFFFEWRGEKLWLLV